MVPPWVKDRSACYRPAGLYPGNKKKGRKAAVVQAMMLAVKAQLDLSDPYEAMIWAYCCTCWQGGRRSSELVRGKTRTGRWDPEFDMHRGRVSNELGEEGEVQRTVIALAPDKTDVTGEEGHEATPVLHVACSIQKGVTPAIVNPRGGGATSRLSPDPCSRSVCSGSHPTVTNTHKPMIP